MFLFLCVYFCKQYRNTVDQIQNNFVAVLLTPAKTTNDLDLLIFR